VRINDNESYESREQVLLLTVVKRVAITLLASEDG